MNHPAISDVSMTSNPANTSLSEVQCMPLFLIYKISTVAVHYGLRDCG
jgi:hypothetical protein